MLERLVRATGHHLVLDLERSAIIRPVSRHPLGRRLRQRRRSILACATLHGASNVRVFGSTARGEDRPDSDVDLVVDLDKGTGLFALEALRRELSEILGVPVDVAHQTAFDLAFEKRSNARPSHYERTTRRRAPRRHC